MSSYTMVVPPTTQLHRKEIELRLGQLRDFVGAHERWFNSHSEVIQYLNDIGVRNAYDRRITPAILGRFRRKLGFPYAHFHETRARIVTSNLMIMAWLWALRVHKATKSYRPNTRDLVNATTHLI